MAYQNIEIGGGWVQGRCPKCGSTNVFPTHIGDGAMCIPCGHEFSMAGSWWRRLWRALTGS